MLLASFFCRKPSLLCLLTAAGLALLPAPAAHACSGFACRPGALLPKDQGHVPANAVELFWSPPYTFTAGLGADAGAGSVHLYKIENGMRTELAIKLTQEEGVMRVVPKTAVAAGSELSFESELPLCNAMEERATFKITVDAAAPAPTRAGQLRVVSTGPAGITLPVYTGECTGYFNVQAARFAFDLDDAARPYADVLRHSLIVDGVERAPFVEAPQYPRNAPVPSLGGGLGDMIFTVCPNANPRMNTYGDPQSTHKVQWLTRLQDGTQLRSNEVTIELVCPPAPPDAGVDAGDASATDAASADARPVDDTRDGGSAATDADAHETSDATAAQASQPDATSEIPVDNTRGSFENDSLPRGCALRQWPAPGQPNEAPWALALALTLRFTLRRTRAARRARVDAPAPRA